MQIPGWQTKQSVSLAQWKSVPLLLSPSGSDKERSRVRAPWFTIFPPHPGLNFYRSGPPDQREVDGTSRETAVGPGR